ncbi:MAG TPA: DHA2 family efflux MFS transporter permease subunit [Acidimicrobiia bacterium]|nr:DHA2 family efflux MFS transporter permease subunit [Acidimicrobiia bacterium]
MVEDGYDHNKRWWTLVVLCLSLVIVVVGNTVLNVALPTLVRELHASNSALQWVVDAYGLVFAGLLLTAGAIGDRFGRKGALTAGLLIFGGASTAAAFAASSGQLIVLRAVMGIGAALIMPATLSILTNVFPPHERAKAIALWAGLAGAGAAVGPVAGGFLLEHFWWGSVFLVNLPLVVAALVAGRVLVPQSRDPHAEKLDPTGAILSMAGLAGLLYGIIEGPAHGWAAPATLGPLLSGLAVLVVFGLWELRAEHPMLDLRFFKNPTFTSATLAINMVFFAMFGTFFLLTQYLQLVLGYGTLEAGVRMLPMAFTMMVAAPSSAKFVAKFGSRKVVSTGLLILGLGLLLLAQSDVATPYWHLVVAIVTMAVGMGLSMAPSTTGIMASLPLRKAGVGSAVNDTTRELGGALGVAVLGSLLASKFTAALPASVLGLPAPARAAVRSSLGGALGVARSLPPAVGVPLEAAAKGAFVSAMGVSLVAAAIVAVAAAVMVRRFYPDRIVMQYEAPGHGAPSQPDDGAAAPEAVPATVGATQANGNGRANGNGHSVEGFRPLEETGQER